MKFFVLIFAMTAALGCDGAIETLSTSIGGMTVTEHETGNMVCAVARFGEKLSISCVPK